MAEDGGSTASDFNVADALIRELARSPAVEPGERVGEIIGRYRLLALIGTGGMGRVYEAEDLELGRRVAVKFVRAGGASGLERFLRERSVTAQLEHPGIVPVHDCGTSPRGEPFYVMRIARGEPLDRLLAGAGTLDERLALLPSVIAVADAIAFAHSRGVVHRDLKPANVLVGAFGETLVADWGLAKRLGDAVPDADATPPPAQPGDTAAGAVVGTPAYMAPEQAAGRPVDERADVYAIGAMLHHLLTGRPPRPEDAPASDALADLVAIARKACAADPAARYPRAEALAEDLRRARTGQIVGARVYTRAELLRRWARRHRAELSLAAVLGLVLAAVVAASVVRVVHERDVARRRNEELTLLQAGAELTRDPTAALAWLKRYPPGAAGWPTAASIAADAGARGVARHVWDLGEPLGAVAFAPDGAWVAATGLGGTLILVEVATGRRLVYRAEGGTGERVVFSPDGTLVATTDGHEAVRLWQRATGASRLLEGEHAGGANLAFAPDGALLLARHPGGGARLWRVPSGDAVPLPGDDRRLLAFVPGRREVALARGDGLALLDVGTGRIGAEVRLDGATEDVWASGDGRWIGASRFDALALWRPDTGELRRVPGGDGTVRLLTPSPDGRVFVSCGRGSNDLWLFDLAALSSRRLSSDEGCSRTSSGFAPDGAVFVSAGFGGELRLHDVADGRTSRLLGHESAVSGVAFAPDGRTLASVSADRTLRLWPIGGGDLRVLHDAKALDAIARDGRLLVTSASTGALALVDVHGGAPEPVSPPRPPATQDRGALSASGAVAVFLDEHDAWQVWEARARAGRPLAAHPPIAVRDCVEALAPGGERLAQVDGLGVVRVVELGSGATRELGRLGDAGFSIVFSADGLALAAGARDGGARVWDLGSGAERAHLRCQGLVWDLGFARDGGRLAAACTDGIVRVLDLASGAVTELRGHVGATTGADFTPDGTRVLSSGADGTVRLWDLATGAGVIVRREPGAVRATYSRDGAWVLTQSGTTLRVWDPAALPPLAPDPARLSDWIAATTSAEVDAQGRLATP